MFDWNYKSHEITTKVSFYKVIAKFVPISNVSKYRKTAYILKCDQLRAT